MVLAGYLGYLYYHSIWEPLQNQDPFLLRAVFIFSPLSSCPEETMQFERTRQADVPISQTPFIDPLCIEPRASNLNKSKLPFK